MAAKAAPKKNLSAEKRIRQAEAKREKNRSVKKTLKTLVKKVEKEVAEKNAEKAPAALKEVVSALDKAVRKGIIHRNTASRRVARLTKMVNSLLPSAAA